MKATFNRKALLEAFTTVASVVPARSPKPILQNVKLVIDNDECTLIATDLEVGVRRTLLGVKFDRDGHVILPTDRVSQILRTSIDDEISIEADDDKLLIRGKRSRFNLPNEEPSLFPEPAGFDSESYMVLIDSDLKKLIKRTAFATDLNSARYALGGVLVERADDSVSFVGTDGRRLARATVPAERVGDVDDSQCVLPVKALKLIDKALSGDGDQIHVAFLKGVAVVVRSSNSVIYSRLVEGRFPRYQDVFPKSSTYTIPLDVASFLSATQQASIVTSEESRGVTFKFSSDGVELTSNASDVGQSCIELPLLGGFDGDGMSLTMDPQYVVEALRSLEMDTVLTVDLLDPKNAVVFRSGENYTYVVMPINK
ncbi:MAG: DNA polymerase III subunit beta [Candidatus Pacebacteria bacterium]|nr:DNA polymerase III subunit beta [Candidatus Paceibacterota bacterium]